MQTTIFLSCLLLAAIASAWPTPVDRSLSLGPGKCEHLPVRKEWLAQWCNNVKARSETPACIRRSLSEKEKKDYIDAVLCLQKKPAITQVQFSENSFLRPVNHFDDLHAVHHNQTPSIHFVGHFALWHRYFVAEYEKTLRSACEYRGAQPYWDWSLDASPINNDSTAIFESAIFSPDTGFGGNGPYVSLTPDQDPFNFTSLGRTGGGCVQDGPFTTPNFHVNVNVSQPTCLKRDFTPLVMNWFALQENVDYVLSQPDYTSFARALEGIPSFSEPNIHGGGHFGIGGALGQMGNAYNSPGDPLFYLHHANVDRVLWLWQQRDLEIRLAQVGGPVIPFDYSGVNVTLDFEVGLGAIAGAVTLGDLLDSEGGVLCYRYDK